MTRRPVKRAKLAVDGADIGVVDVAVDKIGHLAIRMHRHPALMGGLHQFVEWCLIVENNGLFRGQSERRTRLPRPRGLSFKNVLPIHVNTSIEALTNNPFNVFNRLRAIIR